MHTHALMVSPANADTSLPSGNVLGAANNLYGNTAALTALAASTVGNIGGTQPHLNMQPFLTLLFCVALQGIFPSQN